MITFKKFVLGLLLVPALVRAQGRIPSIHADTAKIGGTPAVATSSVFDVFSTTAGALLPRMTTTQRDAIATPATGLLIYNTSTSQFNYYNGSAWTGLSIYTNPMTTNGDMIIQSSGMQSRLALGSSGLALTSNGSLPTWGTIGDAGISSSAGIGLSKLATMTTGRAVVSDVSGFLTPATTTATELGYVSGVTSSIQTQFGTKAPIASPTFTGVVTTPGATVTAPLTMSQSSTPSAPSAGSDKLYFKSDDNLYYQTSAGVETAVGTGASTGGTNSFREYISNGKAESATTGTTGWSIYNDGALTTPTDGTGGTVTGVTYTRTTTAGEVIRETASFKLAKDAANRMGEGDSYDFTLDPQDYKNSRAVFVTFDYQTTTNYVNDYVTIWVYDKDAGALQDCKGFTGETTAPLAPIKKADTGGKFACVFYPKTSTSVNYRLIAHISNTDTNAWNVMFDSVHVGPDVLAPTPFVTPWQSYTTNCSGSWSTNTTYTCLMRRDGDMDEFDIQVATSGAPTTASLTINLPVTIDTAKLAGGNNPDRTPFGTGQVLDGGVAGYFAYVDLNNSTSVRILIGNATATNVATNAVTQAAPMTFGAGDYVTVHFKVPVLNQAATNMLSTQDISLQNPANTPLTATSSAKTPSASGQYQALTGNSIVLSKGVYILYGVCAFGNSGSSPGYSQAACGFFGANGADSSSGPAGLASAANLTVLSAVVPNSFGSVLNGTSGGDSNFLPVSPIKVRCASSCTVYLDTFAAMSTAANSRITVYANAELQPDFTVFGAFASPPTVSVVTATSHSGGFSANSSGTYTTPSGVRYIRVRMAGGGGGGSGSGTAGQGNGGDGGATTFGTTLLTANGGTKGTASGGNGGGAGGSASLGTGPLGTAITGGGGNASGAVNATGYYLPGGMGGANSFGGASGSNSSGAGQAGAANSGAGGGGAQSSAGTGSLGGSGGGAGGFVDAIINAPNSSYAFAVGAGGAGGTSGTGGFAGGAGASGQIIVEEYY